MLFRKMDALIELDNLPNWKKVSVDELRDKIKGSSILDVEEFGDNGMLLLIKTKEGVIKVVDVFADCWNYKPLKDAELWAKELKKKRIKVDKFHKPIRTQIVTIG